jgi:hypothetical protein
VKDSDDVDSLKKAMDELSGAIQKVGAAMYQQQGQPAGTPGAGQSADGPAQEAKPVDAEFEDVNKDKKE